MKFSIRQLQLMVVVAFFFVVLIIMIPQETPPNLEMTKKPVKNTVDMESDQSFSYAAGSTIEYNIYLKNKGTSIANYTLTALSNRGYYVEVWRDTNQVGGGDIQLVPPPASTITLNAGEVATLIVRVTIPPDVTAGTVDATIIEAVSPNLGTSDSVTVTTTINSNLPYPSNWIQLGSDPVFPAQVHPKKMDIKALYYTNNGTCVFFKMAEADTPDTTPFRYTVYLDTRAGGQQIGSHSYDYLLNSDGTQYEWNGTDWIDSEYPAYCRVDGTGIVLWADLNNLSLDTQDINVLACTKTKDETIKDELGSYTILRDNISEIPLILIPLLALAVYFIISRRREKNARAHNSILKTHG